jgi:hypothetical protein
MTIKLWSLPEGRLIKTLVGQRGGVNGLAFSQDGKMLVSSAIASEVVLWSLPEGGLQQRLAGGMAGLATSPNGRMLATAQNRTIMLWTLPDGEFRGCLGDIGAAPLEVTGITYQRRNEYGQIVTYTLPCGSPIPPGAICTCNCVPGSAPVEVPAQAREPVQLPVPVQAPPPPPAPGRSWTEPCTPTPVPPGAICTCNCIPVH